MWHIQPHLKAFLSRVGHLSWGQFSCYGQKQLSKLLSADKDHEM